MGDVKVLVPPTEALAALASPINCGRGHHWGADRVIIGGGVVAVTTGGSGGSTPLLPRRRPGPGPMPELGP